MNDTYRVEVPHPDDGDYHEWIFESGVGTVPMVWRDRIGRRERSCYVRWIRFRCNNSSCSAKALVSEKSIRGLLPEVPEMGD